MKPLVCIDTKNCFDPTVNLATEEYVLRHLDPAHDYFILYRNEPTVVVGRNQNVFEEIDDEYVHDKKIRILRRLSGGGTVYHDPGNLNFSFITNYDKSKLHNFPFFNEPVIRILQSLGVDAAMNDRNDIVVHDRKISGNAQFSSRGRMFSHGTLLFDSDLNTMDRILNVTNNHIHSRSSKSVRSVVANISDFLATPMDIHLFQDRLLNGMRESGVIIENYTPDAKDMERIRQIRQERYLQWDWNFGRSPKFHITRTRTFDSLALEVYLEVEKGKICDIDIRINRSDEKTLPEYKKTLPELGRILEGVRYDPVEIGIVLNRRSGPPPFEFLPVEQIQQLLFGK